MSRTFRFDKLVTDRVVENSLAEEHTLEITYRRLTGAPLLRELRRKLIEEACEIPVTDKVTDDVLDEIVDAQVVLDEIKRRYDIDEESFRDHRQKRKAKKGTFSEGFFVDSVTLHEDSPWIEYFEADPTRYPRSKTRVATQRLRPGYYPKTVMLFTETNIDSVAY